MAEDLIQLAQGGVTHQAVHLREPHALGRDVAGPAEGPQLAQGGSLGVAGHLLPVTPHRAVTHEGALRAQPHRLQLERDINIIPRSGTPARA
eukprot:8059466-Pyramimonas_sp.AAC.1